MKNYLIAKLKASSRFLNFAAAVYNSPAFLNIRGRRQNNIQYAGAFLRKTKIQIKGKNNRVKIASENRLNNCLLHINGNNCQINIEKHCILSNVELWIEDDGGIINIGYRSTMEGGHIAATEGKTITIGEDCMFSYRIEIRNGDSHSILNKESSQRINSGKDIKIGNHVWLGADVKIMKGSEVEDGAIIAAGAIVTGHVDPNTIYAGVPSEKVKENIYWKRERI